VRTFLSATVSIHIEGQQGLVQSAPCKFFLPLLSIADMVICLLQGNYRMPKKTELAGGTPKTMDMDEALRFLVKFANAKIDALKRTPDDPQGLPTLFYLIRRYLDVTDEAELKRSLETARTRPETLEPSIRDIRRLLNAALEGRVDDTEFPLNKKRKIRLVVRDSEFKLQRDGDLRESLIETAFEDIADTKLELLRIGKCQREGCDNFFFKVKLNQAYCDHQCANKAAAARRSKGSTDSTTPAEPAGKQRGAKS
jgi:hypothetical protein